MLTGLVKAALSALLFLALLSLAACQPNLHTVKVKEASDEPFDYQRVDIKDKEAMDKFNQSVDSDASRAPHPGGDERDYRIAPNDLLKITVFGEEDLTMEQVRVTAEGEINFPFIGRVVAADKTSSQVERMITKRLIDEGYLVNPNVSVLVVEYRSRWITVLGAVKEPGQYEIKDKEITVVEAIGLAGGFDDGAAKRSVRVIRKAAGKEKIIQVNVHNIVTYGSTVGNIVLKPDDIIEVPGWY